MAQPERIQQQPDIDLSRLSVDELKRLADHARKQIKKREEQRRRDAFKRIEALASELGLTKADLAAHYGKKARKPSPPKYRNPEKPAQTWTGRGRQPAWVQKHLERGGALEELAI